MEDNPLSELFLTETPQTPEDLLMELDTFALIKAKNYGGKLLKDATQQANKIPTWAKCRKDIDNDITLIQNNLKKINKAYNLAMN